MSEPLEGRSLDVAVARAMGCTMPPWSPGLWVGQCPCGKHNRSGYREEGLIDYQESAEGLLQMLHWANSKNLHPWVEAPYEGETDCWRAQCLDAEGNRHYGLGDEPGTALARALVAAAAAGEQG